MYRILSGIEVSGNAQQSKIWPQLATNRKILSISATFEKNAATNTLSKIPQYVPKNIIGIRWTSKIKTPAYLFKSILAFLTKLSKVQNNREINGKGSCLRFLNGGVLRNVDMYIFQKLYPICSSTKNSLIKDT